MLTFNSIFKRSIIVGGGLFVLHRSTNTTFCIGNMQGYPGYDPFFIDVFPIDLIDKLNNESKIKSNINERQLKIFEERFRKKFKLLIGLSLIAQGEKGNYSLNHTFKFPNDFNPWIGEQVNVYLDSKIMESLIAKIVKEELAPFNCEYKMSFNTLNYKNATITINVNWKKIIL